MEDSGNLKICVFEIFHISNHCIIITIITIIIIIIIITIVIIVHFILIVVIIHALLICSGNLLPIQVAHKLKLKRHMVIVLCIHQYEVSQQ